MILQLELSKNQNSHKDSAGVLITPYQTLIWTLISTNKYIVS